MPRAKKTSRLKQVAVIYDAKLRYDVKIIEGVAAYVREVDDWDIFIEENALNHQQLPDLRSWKGDGILADFDDPAVAKAVVSSGITAVAFGGGYGWYDPASKIPYCYTNNAGVAELAANHLLQRGFRHFAFCGYRRTPINGWSDERAEVFSRRIREAGFSCECHRGPKHAARDWPAFRRARSWTSAVLPVSGCRTTLRSSGSTTTRCFASCALRLSPASSRARGDWVTKPQLCWIG